MAKSRREKEKKVRRYASAKAIAEKNQNNFQVTHLDFGETPNFRFKEAKVYKLDFLPFEAKEGNPNTDAGYYTYERTYYVHRGVGPNNKTFCCLARNWDEACPICEHQKVVAEEDREAAKAFYPNKRQLILLRDKGDAKVSGAQVYEGPYFNGLGQVIDERIEPSEEDDPARNFFHAEGGMTTKVAVKEESYEGRKFMKPTTIIEMSPRKDLDDDFLDSLPCLDDLLIKPDYDELHAAFHGKVDDDEEDEEKASHKKNGKPAAKKKAKPEPEDEDEDELDAEEGEECPYSIGDTVIHDDHGECTVFDVSEDGTSLTLKNKKGKKVHAISPDDVYPPSEDEEEEAPKAKASKKPAKKGKPEPEEDDEDSDDSNDSDDEDDDSDDSWDDDDESDSDDDEDSDDEDDWTSDEDTEDEEDEEDEAPPKKKRK